MVMTDARKQVSVRRVTYEVPAAPIKNLTHFSVKKKKKGKKEEHFKSQDK